MRLQIGNRLGDALGHLAIVVWLSVAVGPWWVGLVLLAAIIIINTVQATWINPD